MDGQSDGIAEAKEWPTRKDGPKIDLAESNV